MFSLPIASICLLALINHAYSFPATSDASSAKVQAPPVPIPETDLSVQIFAHREKRVSNDEIASVLINAYRFCNLYGKREMVVSPTINSETLSLKLLAQPGPIRYDEASDAFSVMRRLARDGLWSTEFDFDILRGGGIIATGSVQAKGAGGDDKASVALPDTEIGPPPSSILSAREARPQAGVAAGSTLSTIPVPGGLDLDITIPFVYETLNTRAASAMLGGFIDHLNNYGDAPMTETEIWNGRGLECIFRPLSDRTRRPIKYDEAAAVITVVKEQVDRGFVTRSIDFTVKIHGYDIVVAKGRLDTRPGTEAIGTSLPVA
ncbi:uncharacterized protein KY384_008019 [Bacidia gigantensis]|uniref:uncharacterized protein n=1 Tax=Bacidia gigantensis TaxID=2732470 RepID=UPI001D0515CA|nr:uncharacterized protein KY384_008019 [Bacidia gigantensis]KAG8527275.1 hypothetical protein KY384_008019 [Bacidia gigantensis]